MYKAGQAVKLMLFPVYVAGKKIWEMTYRAIVPGMDLDVAGSDIVTETITHREALALNGRGEFVRYEE